MEGQSDRCSWWCKAVCWYTHSSSSSVFKTAQQHATTALNSTAADILVAVIEFVSSLCVLKYFDDIPKPLRCMPLSSQNCKHARALLAGTLHHHCLPDHLLPLDTFGSIPYRIVCSAVHTAGFLRLFSAFRLAALPCRLLLLLLRLFFSLAMVEYCTVLGVIAAASCPASCACQIRWCSITKSCHTLCCQTLCYCWQPCLICQLQ